MSGSSFVSLLVIRSEFVEIGLSARGVGLRLTRQSAVAALRNSALFEWNVLEYIRSEHARWSAHVVAAHMCS